LNHRKGSTATRLRPASLLLPESRTLSTPWLRQNDSDSLDLPPLFLRPLPQAGFDLQRLRPGKHLLLPSLLTPFPPGLDPPGIPALPAGPSRGPKPRQAAGGLSPAAEKSDSSGYRLSAKEGKTSPGKVPHRLWPVLFACLGGEGAVPAGPFAWFLSFLWP
jgi:hypothetical protein